MTEHDFWQHVDRTGGPDACWPWTGKLTKDGYGLVRFGGRSTLTHIVAYTLATGQPVLPGIVIRHFVCANRACCNPAHLRPGSHADNMLDRERDGHTARGERNGRTPFTEADVLQMRQWWRRGLVTINDLARMYGVDRRGIGRIVHRQTWQHLALTGDGATGNVSTGQHMGAR